MQHLGANLFFKYILQFVFACFSYKLTLTSRVGRQYSVSARPSLYWLHMWWVEENFLLLLHGHEKLGLVARVDQSIYPSS